MFRSIAFSFLIGLGLVLGFGSDASAQRTDDRFMFLRDPFGRGRSLFNFPDAPPPPPRRIYVEPPSDQPTGTVYGTSADADAQRFLSATEYVLVLGDTIAEQLSQGLADEFVSDRPEVAIVKKTRINSGFVRTDVFDWNVQASTLLAKEKATAIVVLLGVNDRQPLRDESGPQEFRSDKWRELYGKRVEDFLIKLKEKNVPIFVVGLASMRYPKMSLDAVYLNEILAERTRKVGGYYVDVWDGFVAENGDFMATGPALDGQTRRLRATDGVHFTKAGQRKLAHYVERELVRLFDSRPGRTPVVPRDSTPEVSAKPPVGQATAPASRPVAGPVLPLSQLSGPAGPLAGAPGLANAAAQAKVTLPTDPNSTRTLLEGIPVEAMAGRADDFRWPIPGSVTETAPQTPTEPSAVDSPSVPQLRPLIAPPKDSTRSR